MDLYLSDFIKHPEKLNKDSLPRLSKLVNDFPYFQPARLIYLKNLYILHHNDFDKELRRAAYYLPDRRTLFQLIEGDNYTLTTEKRRRHTWTNAESTEDEDRTCSLIDNFLSNLPQEKPRRQTHADASTDYIAYLLQNEDAPQSHNPVPPMQHQELIDNYISQGDKRIVLTQNDDEEIQAPVVIDRPDEDYFTETLAKIYIKQGRYTKALEIIKRLNLKYPKKNRYFADQIRFLEKLIINNKNKKP